MTEQRTDTRDLKRFAPVVRDVRFHGEVVTKRATLGRAKLLREYAWLEAIPRGWAVHFPRLIALRNGPGWAEYDMVRCPWPNFAESVVAGRVGAHEAEVRISTILEFVFGELLTHKSGSTPDDYFKTSYIDKFMQRSRAGVGLSRVFDAVTSCSEFIINGVRHQGAGPTIEAIAQSRVLAARLQPPHVVMFHGDLKPDNILIGPSAEQFMLVDPRGSTATGAMMADPVEDLAKLRTSCHSLYDLVRAGAFEVEIDLPRIDFRLRSGHPAQSVFFAMDRRLCQFLADRFDDRYDPHWRIRLAYIEAMLLLANAPFQLVDDTRSVVEVAVLLHVIGLQRLGEALATEANLFELPMV